MRIGENSIPMSKMNYHLTNQSLLERKLVYQYTYGSKLVASRIATDLAVEY
jgi:hypothetical protein